MAINMIGAVRLPNNTLFASSQIIIRRNEEVVSQSSSVMLVDEWIVTTDASGEVDFDIEAGRYFAFADTDAGRVRWEFNVATTPSVQEFKDCVAAASDTITPPLVQQAIDAADRAEAAAASKPMSPVAFGAIGDNVTDDTAAVTAALNYNGPVDWGDLTYRITSAISITRTSAIRWISYGARIRYDGATAQRAVQIQMAGFSFSSDGVLTFDANLKAFDAFYCENDTAFTVQLTAKDLRAVNAYRASTAFTGGNGMWFRGNFSPLVLENPRVSNCLMAAGAGVSGSQGIAGITISTSSGGYAPGAVSIYDPDIDTVASEDLTYTDDQDGIKAFDKADGASTMPYETSVRIYGGRIKNTPGRFIKSQVEDTVVDGVKLILDTGFNSSGTPILGNPAIDMQVGGGLVTGCTFMYTTYAHSCIAQFGGTLDTAASGKNVAGGTVRDCNVYLKSTPQIDRLVKFAPALSDDFTVTVDNVQVISSTALVNKVLGGSLSSTTGNENLRVHRFRGSLATAFVEIVGSGTANISITDSINLATAVPLTTGAGTVGGLYVDGVRGATDLTSRQRGDTGETIGQILEYASTTQGIRFVVDNRATDGLELFSSTFPITVSAGAGDGVVFKVNAGTTAMTLDSNGILNLSNPLDLASYAKASLPSAANASRLIYVTDDVGGATPAFSDGTNWRRVADRAVIS